mmetsp:Transcript_15311/g.23317  ORF Transcript_15311/g.23317 Transcript_15311/m.23317 type:complete len:85 (+) Transcript_15311:89-343(+)
MSYAYLFKYIIIGDTGERDCLETCTSRWVLYFDRDICMDGCNSFAFLLDALGVSGKTGMTQGLDQTRTIFVVAVVCCLLLGCVQ